MEIWQTEKGLPQNGITAILQSRQGYLWLGTYGGLVRFDGAQFKVFDAGNAPGMQNSRVTALFEDREGALWIGHETGDLTVLRDGHFEPVRMQGDAPEKVNGIFEAAPGKMRLLLKSGRVRRSEDGALMELDSRGDQNPGTIFGTQDLEGGIWILHGGTVWKGSDDKWERVEFDHKASDQSVQGFGAARDGGLWVAGNGRIREWKDGKWTRDLGGMPGRPGFLTVLLEMQNGALALGTVEQGLFILRPGAEAIHFGRDSERDSGLPQDWIRSACEDHEGNLWIGSGGAGLVALRPARAMALNPPDLWQGRNLLGVTASRDGSLWIGTEGSGIYHYSGNGKWERFGQSDGVANAFVWSLAEDRDGRLWAGSWGGGVTIFNREKKIFEAAPGFDGIDPQAPAMLATVDGAVWIGTGAGLVRAKDGKAEVIAGPGQVNAPDVRAIAQDSNGVIWFGMQGGGLGQILNGSVRQFQKRDGLASDFVQCLLADTDGSLWIGTADVGLIRMKNGRFKKLNTAQGLPNNVICHIADDGQGNLWIGTHGGIARVSKSDLNKAADGETPAAPFLTYGRADGLPTLLCSGGLQPAGCRTADGQLWFSVTKSLVVVDPARVWTNQIPPRVLIEDFVVNDTNTPLRNGIKIPPGRQRFDLKYTALSFAAPERVLFKYRLEGLEKDWVSAGTQRSKSYSYLAPGPYTFRVIACNNDGVWNTTGASFAFTVLPFFWQTVWFRALMVAALIAMAGSVALLAARRKYRRRVELAERQRVLERERARIAQDIHDDIGASLTRITLLSQSPREEDLDRIYHTARNLTRSLDEIVWAVNPRHDTLDSLATYLGKFAQDFLGTAGIRCRLDVPVSLPTLPLTAETRHNVFLAFKEALNNAVKHSGATEVKVSLSFEGTRIVLSIEDNGRGFSESAVELGNGLGNMRNRLGDVGGAFNLESRPGAGTRVVFEIPAVAKAVS